MKKCFFFIFSISLISIITTSCTQIYCCGFPTADYQCKNGTDTIYLHIVGHTSDIQQIINDSVAAYNNRGYICTNQYSDTVYPGIDWAGYKPTCIKGKEHKSAVAGGMHCEVAEGHDHDNCQCY